MDSTKPTKVPKSTPKILIKLLFSEYRISGITGKINQFSAVGKKGHLHYMAEIEKEAVVSPVLCHHVAREFTPWEFTPFFILNLFTSFSCMQKIVKSGEYVGRQAIALPSIEQIV